MMQWKSGQVNVGELVKRRLGFRAEWGEWISLRMLIAILFNYFMIYCKRKKKSQKMHSIKQDGNGRSDKQHYK